MFLLCSSAFYLPFFSFLFKIYYCMSVGSWRRKPRRKGGMKNWWDGSIMKKNSCFYFGFLNRGNEDVNSCRILHISSELWLYSLTNLSMSMMKNSPHVSVGYFENQKAVIARSTSLLHQILTLEKDAASFANELKLFSIEKWGAGYLKEVQQALKFRAW